VISEYRPYCLYIPFGADISSKYYLKLFLHHRKDRVSIIKASRLVVLVDITKVFLRIMRKNTNQISGQNVDVKMVGICIAGTEL
jgi:hypothetical protein